MKNELFIAWKILRGKYSFGIISYSSFLSIIGLAIGFTSIILIQSFSQGFILEVKKKLSSIDGHIRIEKIGIDEQEFISNLEFESIKRNLENNSEILSLNSFNQSNGMFYKNNLSDGTLVFGMNYSLLNFISKNSDINPINASAWNDSSIIVGKDLAVSLNIKEGDFIYLFNLNSMIESNQLDVIRLHLIGTIETGFKEYDKMISFIPQKLFQNFFQQKDKSNGIIIQLKDYSLADLVKTEIQNSLGIIPFIITTWRDRHDMLFSWMNYFHLPLQLLMIFISLIAIFNIASTLWLMILEKYKNIAILKTLGYNDKIIIRIYIYLASIISFCGISLGLMFSGLILFLQDKFHFISLSSEVYFLDHLPSVFNLHSTFYILLIGLLLNLLFSVLPILRIRNIYPAVVLRED